MRKKGMTHYSGFTLVELMIVVVIIGILAAIAVPKFSYVVTRSKLTEVKRQLKHIVEMEQAYFYSYSEYKDFDYGDDSTEIGFYQPANSPFTYKFDAASLTATGKENLDVNGDNDGDDGLTLTIETVQGILSGSAGDDFSW